MAAEQLHPTAHSVGYCLAPLAGFGRRGRWCLARTLGQPIRSFGSRRWVETTHRTHSLIAVGDGKVTVKHFDIFEPPLR